MIANLRMTFQDPHIISFSFFFCFIPIIYLGDFSLWWSLIDHKCSTQSQIWTGNILPQPLVAQKEITTYNTERHLVHVLPCWNTSFLFLIDRFNAAHVLG